MHPCAELVADADMPDMPSSQRRGDAIKLPDTVMATLPDDGAYSLRSATIEGERSLPASAADRDRQA